MAKKNIDKMRELFLLSKDSESEEIQLDNLDDAKLVRVGNDVVVENEHGTQFPITDLSAVEVKIFIYVLQH